tara:strand:- start:379 stop:558 length:180 start_codon:yes stop_codon:yes gene_type:complete
MTKKHFEAIADKLRQDNHAGFFTDDMAFQECIATWCEVLSDYNSLFDPSRFEERALAVD